MKINEIPLNTIVELQFDYLDEQYSISAGVLYLYMDTVYVSAVKNSGVTIPAKKLKNIKLIYRAEACTYLFDYLTIRSTSYYGQNLYAIKSMQDAQILISGTSFRLFIGSPVCAKLLRGDSIKQSECILKSISMTSMEIICNKKLDEVTKIQISFRVNDYSNEILVGNIVQIQKFKNNDCFLYTCEFEEPNIIIGSYVARRQAELNLKQEEMN